MKHVGVVSNSYNSNVAVQLRETESALRKFNVQKRIVRHARREEYDRASEFGPNTALTKSYCSPTLLWSNIVERIAKLAQTAKVPTAFQRRENVLAGGLFSYGGSIANQYRYAALYVDRILKGAKAGELPVEADQV